VSAEGPEDLHAAIAELETMLENGEGNAKAIRAAIRRLKCRLLTFEPEFMPSVETAIENAQETQRMIAEGTASPELRARMRHLKCLLLKLQQGSQ